MKKHQATEEDLKYLDSSKMKTYLECPRKFYWRYVRHLVPERRPAALNFGTAIHSALYVWYDLRNEDVDPEDRKQYAIDIFHNHWTDREGDDKRTHEKGEKLLEEYFEKHPKEPFEFLTPPETAFKISFHNDYHLIGRFDGVINYNGMIMPLDHKTTSRMGKYYYNRFRPDLQMSKYCWVAQKIAQQQELDDTVHGAYINVLYFTKTKIGFDRQIVNREPWELEQFEKVTLEIMDKINSHDINNMESWMPNWTSCTRWGSCKYRDLCTTEEPEKLIDFMYEYEEWDPLEELNPKIELRSDN